MTSTSWKTTLGGLVTGLGVAGDAILQAYAAGSFTGKTGLQLLAAVGIVILGLYAKDNNVTGGTVVNTNNDANVVVSSGSASVAGGTAVEPSKTGLSS